MGLCAAGRWGRSKAGWLAAVASLAIFASSAPAATIKVHNTHDSGPGSLRQALANADPNDTIKVPAGTYHLETVLVVSKPMTIKGAGAKRTILDPDGHSRALYIDQPDGDVAVQGLTVTDGKASPGGGIMNHLGDLTLRSVVVRGNLASGDPSQNFGGGIASTGDLTVIGSSVRDNTAGVDQQAQGLGGGIAASVQGASGKLVVKRSTIDGNVARGQFGGGGGIFSSATDPPDGAGVTITKSTLSHNSASTLDPSYRSGGGGLYFEPVVNQAISELPFVLKSDTFAANRAVAPSDFGMGGAIYFSPVANAAVDVSVTMENDTISGNQAGNSDSPGFAGGLLFQGVFNGPTQSTQTYRNLTIADNVAAHSGTAGGLDFENSGNFSGEFRNTIVAGNHAATGPNCGVPPPTGGHNIESHSECDFTAGGDMQDTNPLLAPLSRNGGPTATRMLKPKSPAINAGQDGKCPGTDQRGVHRPQGPHCDIGAVERKHGD